MKRCGAIILAAGSGSRMKSRIPKQFLTLQGCPLFLHSVRQFAGVVDELVLVTSGQDEDYCRRLLEQETLSVPVTVTAGGKERFQSSMAGLLLAKDWEYVMIHDAARACISEDVIRSSLQAAVRYGSGVASVPAKDTIKLAGEDGFVEQTLDRSRLRVVQTPQSFRTEWIIEAYRRMTRKMEEPGSEPVSVTDDAFVLERYGNARVYLSEGSYENIKITTPEDLPLAEEILKRRGSER